MPPVGGSARLLPSARALPLVDGLVALWVAVWIGLGVAIGIDVHHLTQLSDTISADGRAVQQIGRSLSALSGLPFVGGSVGHAARQVQTAGARAAIGGARSATSIRELSVLLAIAVALLPSIPVIGFYVPLRVARIRETRAVRRALREQGARAELRTLLAQRAVARLGYEQVRAAIAGCETDAEAREARLAAAELRRLGIDPRALAPRGGMA